MAANQDRPRRVPLIASVIRKEMLTAHMIRIVFGGEGLKDFSADEFTDHYVKLQLPPPGSDYSAPFDPEKIRETLPAEEWFRTRTYSIRYWDKEARELTIDFVHHGDAGIAGPWALAAEPGDRVQFLGPGGGYRPDPEADWPLLVGDEACVPAISAALTQIPSGVPVIALIEVEDQSEQLDLESSGDLDLRWLHRNGKPRTEGDLLLTEVSKLDLPDGRGQAFVHGEAGMVREVRKHLLLERGLGKADLSATGYWKYTETEEGWRMYKREWKRLVELDVKASGLASD